MKADTQHFRCEIEKGIATLRLDRPDRKNPLTFESYAELRDWFRELHYDDEVKAVVFASNGGNFSSGGDVHGGSCRSRADRRKTPCRYWRS